MNRFMRKGFDRTTMAEVAAESGFAVGTLYKFFADKQALYRAIILEVASAFHTRLMAALKEPGTETERIERYIDAKMQLLVQYRHIGALFFSGTIASILSSTIMMEKDIRWMYEETLAAISVIFRRGMRKKVFAVCEPQTLFLLLEGLTHAFLPPLVANPEAFTAEQMSAAVKHVFFSGVRR